MRYFFQFAMHLKLEGNFAAYLKMWNCYVIFVDVILMAY